MADAGIAQVDFRPQGCQRPRRFRHRSCQDRRTPVILAGYPSNRPSGQPTRYKMTAGKMATKP